MRKFLVACLIAILIMSLIAPCVFAAPEAIKKDTIDLKADTIFVYEAAGTGATPSAYRIKYVDPDAKDVESCTTIFPYNHSEKFGGYMILKVDISSVKDASDFNLKFSFDTGSDIDNSVFVYCADYSDGQALTDGLAPGSIKNVTKKPDICTAWSNKHIYQFDKAAASEEKVDVEISTADSAVLKNHMDNAISKGEGSVYFLILGKSGSSGAKSASSYFKYYNSASADKAPTLLATASSVSSVVTETETGYTVSVSGLKNYSEKVLIAVTAYDSEDSLIQTSASGQTAVTTVPVDVTVSCKNADKLKLYIWHAETLEPVTYPETIVLK